MTDSADEVIHEGRPATAEEERLLDWGRESDRKSNDRLGEAIQRLLTLDVSLLGGSLFFLKEDVAGAGWRSAALLAFLASLAAALHGSLPVVGPVMLNVPDDVARHKAEVFARRRRWLRVAAACLWAGLAVGVAGVVARTLGTG